MINNSEILHLLRSLSLEERLSVISMFLNNEIDFGEEPNPMQTKAFILSQNPFDGTPALPGIIYKSNKI